jgi:hypothetical protein
MTYMCLLSRTLKIILKKRSVDGTFWKVPLDRYIKDLKAPPFNFVNGNYVPCTCIWVHSQNKESWVHLSKDFGNYLF